MNKEVNVYSFNDECYVYLNDYKQLQQKVNQLETNRDDTIEYIKENMCKEESGCGLWWYQLGDYETPDELLSLLERGKE